MQHTAAANRRLPVSMLRKLPLVSDRRGPSNFRFMLRETGGAAGAATIQSEPRHPADANLFARTGHMTNIDWSHGGDGRQNKR